MVELIIEQMAAALAVIGDEVFVVAGHVNALHMLRRSEPNQDPLALVEAKNRLVVEYVGHRPVGRRLARYRAGMGVAKMAVNTQGAEQIVRRDLLVDDVVQLFAADRFIERFAILRLKPGHHRERRTLFHTGFAGAAVGAQLVNFAAKRDQLAVQFIKGPEAEITVGEQIGDGRITFINAAKQRAHQRGLVDDAIGMLRGKSS